MSQNVDYDIGKYLDGFYEVYGEIDHAYKESAVYYGFSCKGCEENCCDTVFYHYSLVEYFGLLEGFARLAEDLKDRSLERARAYVRELNRHRGKESLIRIMCPLNYDGLCSVYENRPLICRIHGLPGELHHPVKGREGFEGCSRFGRTNEKDGEKVIDRTLFYTRIATLENQLRREMGYLIKFRKTIAEMLIDGDPLMRTPGVCFTNTGRSCAGYMACPAGCGLPGGGFRNLRAAGGLRKTGAAGRENIWTGPPIIPALQTLRRS